MIELLLISSIVFSPLVLLVMDLTGLDERLLTSARLRPRAPKEADR